MTKKFMMSLFMSSFLILTEASLRSQSSIRSLFLSSPCILQLVNSLQRLQVLSSDIPIYSDTHISSSHLYDIVRRLQDVSAA